MMYTQHSHKFKMNVKFVLLVFLLKMEDMVNCMEPWSGPAHLGMVDAPIISPSTTHISPIKHSQLDLDTSDSAESSQRRLVDFQDYRKKYGSQDFEAYHTTAKHRKILGSMSPPAPMTMQHAPAPAPGPTSTPNEPDPTVVCLAMCGAVCVLGCIFCGIACTSKGVAGAGCAGCALAGTF